MSNPKTDDQATDTKATDTKATDSQNAGKQTQTKKLSQAQEANRLIAEAVIQLTLAIETMHNRINPLNWLAPSTQSSTPKSKQALSSDITGMVYDSIRGITSEISKRISMPLSVLNDSLNNRGSSNLKDSVGGSASDSANGNVSEDAPPSSPPSSTHSPSPSSIKPTLLSAINGVIGDYLHTQQSPLSIAMTFRQHGNDIELNALARHIAESKGKLLIMVHGLCMNDVQWRQSEHDHGYYLTNDLSCTTAYLHYNTGRHIYQNGMELNALLGKLANQFHSLQSQHSLDISVVAHSMGGLVTRSALYYAKAAIPEAAAKTEMAEENVQWAEYVKKLVFLGTPHHGAPLEKAGNWVDLFLGMHQFTAPLTRITQIRSAGIADLRHGYIVESDTHSERLFDFASDQRKPIPLPDGVACFAIATTSSASPNAINKHLVGDGLVPLNSALGIHENEAFTLNFKPENQWVGNNISHLGLLGNKTIYDVIHRWLS
ncbi:esterase/lipase family protein [Alteromonas sp. A081]|uniref:esterase/lipase family protein n=1 Tax=Alteromonas sp. A081 TaxID=3410269 RepID=UPI003B97DD80